jgi:hypothetical protein
MSDDMTQRPGVDLEDELVALGHDVAYPPTPDLRRSVRMAIEREPDSSGVRLGALFRAPYRRSLVFALIALLLAAGLAVAAMYQLGGLRIVFVDTLPSVPSGAALSGSLGADLALGTNTTLDEAIAKVHYEVFVPAFPALGQPDAVFYGRDLAGGQISLAYGAREGLPAPVAGGVAILVTEFPGGMEEKLAQKSVGPGTTVDVLTVNGGIGFWIEGRPHVIVYRDPTGFYAYESIRLVRNSLAWQQGDTVLRIEGDLSREQALAIAASFQAVDAAP